MNQLNICSFICKRTVVLFSGEYFCKHRNMLPHKWRKYRSTLLSQKRYISGTKSRNYRVRSHNHAKWIRTIFIFSFCFSIFNKTCFDIYLNITWGNNIEMSSRLIVPDFLFKHINVRPVQGSSTIATFKRMDGWMDVNINSCRKMQYSLFKDTWFWISSSLKAKTVISLSCQSVF